MTPVTGTFSGTGSSGVIQLPGSAGDKTPASRFNISMTFVGTATVQLQRSFDNGTTWFVVKEYTASASEVGEEIECGVQYKLACTAHTDNVTYRLSR